MQRHAAAATAGDRICASRRAGERRSYGDAARRTERRAGARIRETRRRATESQRDRVEAGAGRRAGRDASLTSRSPALRPEARRLISIAAAAALGHGAAARGSFLHGVDVLRGCAVDALGHRRVRELPALVRRDVRARDERHRREDDERAQQLFIAPAAAHALRSASAFEFDEGPLGGMFPPSHDRHDCEGSATPGICPRPLSHEYVFDALDVWLWQSEQRPIVPLFR